MTEALYEYFEDDFEEFEEEDERVYAINAEIADFERQHGVELSDDEWQHIGTQIDLYGVRPEEAYGGTDHGRDEEAFAELAERIAIVEAVNSPGPSWSVSRCWMSGPS